MELVAISLTPHQKTPNGFRWLGWVSSKVQESISEQHPMGAPLEVIKKRIKSSAKNKKKKQPFFSPSIFWDKENTIPIPKKKMLKKVKNAIMVPSIVARVYKSAVWDTFCRLLVS